MKGLGGLLIAILGAVALWQFAVEWQRGTFGVSFGSPLEAMNQDQILRTVGPPLSKFGENDGGETWQYTNGRIVRFNYRGKVVTTNGFSALITPAPRLRAPTYIVTEDPNGSTRARDLPPNVSDNKGGSAPTAEPTPMDLDKQRGWKSSSPLDQRAR
jgi:hypothetical protein